VESSPGSSTKNRITFISQFDSKRLYVVLINLILIFATISTYYFTNKLFLKEGDLALSDFFSPVTIRYLNKIKTEELKKKAESKIPISYIIDPMVLDTVMQDLDNFRFLLISNRNNKLKSDIEKKNEVSRLLSLSPDQGKISTFFLTTDEKTLTLLFTISKKVLTTLLQRGVREIDITEYNVLSKSIEEKIKLEDSRDQILQVVSVLIRKKIRFNMSIDEETTLRSKIEAREKIVPIIEDIIQNQRIIQKGQKITPDDLEKLKALGLLSSTQDWFQWLKAGFYSMLLLLLMLYFLWITNKSVYIKKFEYFVLLNFLLFLSVLSVRILSPISQYLVPVLMVTTLLVIFFDVTLAYFVSSFTVLILFSAFGFDMSLTIAYVLTILTSIFLLSNFRKYSDFIKNGFTSTFIFLVFTFSITSLSYESFLHSDKLLLLGFIMINGIGSNLLALGLIVILEYVWNFVTPLRLFELSDPNAPLLRKLFETAPGTYQHSVMLANISSHAGEAIGLDPLLIRVGSYYHDIGKTISAFNFTENSSGGNLLDTMNPNEAADMIKKHITDGLLLAEKFNLPQIIQTFIQQHHGTSRISFLFDSAKKACPDLTDDTPFRYIGPKPSSKEVSIVMLADSIEAATRSLETRTIDHITTTVHKVITFKLRDNQLSESDLTFQELEKITQSFIFSVDSLYHSRVSYTMQESIQPDSR